MIEYEDIIEEFALKNTIKKVVIFFKQTFIIRASIFYFESSRL